MSARAESPHAIRYPAAARGLRWTGVLAISAAAGIGLALSAVSVDAFLVAAIAFVCVGPIAIRILQRRFDVFEPLVIVSLAFLVMYVARPTAMLVLGGPHVFKGYIIDGRITRALVVAFLGVTAAQIGYVLPWGRGLAGRLPTPRGRFNSQSTTLLALVLCGAALGLFGLFLQHSGGLGLLKQLLSGRSALQNTYFQGSTAYLYSAPQLLWPASLLLMALGVAARRKDFAIFSFLALIPLAIFEGARGDRIVLVPLLLSPAVYFYLARDRRPRPLAVMLGFYLIFTVGIAFFRDSRNAGQNISRGAELQHAVLDPSYEFRQLVLHGTDNDMFESLGTEMEVVPSQVPISPLDWLYRTAAKPLPRVLWPAKPLAPDDRLNRALYPTENSTTLSSSSAGVIGDLYLFGGPIGVAAGMLILGALFRTPWEYFKRRRSSPGPALLLTVSLMFVPILLRGTIDDTASRLLFGVVPLFMALRICMEHAPGNSPAADQP